MCCNPYIPGVHLSIQKVPNGSNVRIKYISGLKNNLCVKIHCHLRSIYLSKHTIRANRKCKH